jgi:hypothetical protein
MRGYAAVGAVIVAILGAAQTAAAASWSAQPMPAPQVANGAMDDVSCLPSPSSCTAVGSFVDSTGEQRTQAQRWNGTAWSVLGTTPDKTGSTYNELTSVSCVTASACTAVGEWSGTGIGGSLIERWNGSAWGVQSVPVPSHSQSVGVSSVSCTATTACTAVGAYSNTTTHHIVPLAIRWTGGSWAVQTVPLPSGTTNATFSSVSCKASNACAAVGYASTGGETESLAEAWNGATWTVQGVTLPGGTTSSSLNSVSCASATTCSAVGTYTTSSTSGLFAERLSAGVWSMQTMPSPGSGHSAPGTISCASASSCEAVGLHVVFFSSVPYVERWNGSSWAVQTSAELGSAGGYLNAVACTGVGACTSVGGYGVGGLFFNSPRHGVLGRPRSGRASSVPTSFSGQSTVLAERWNGTAWSAQPTPNHTGAADTQLEATSCGGSSACMAVGFSYRPPDQSQWPVAERWNGSTWTLAPITLPSGSTGGSLAALSCSAANACTAVGQLDTSTTTVALFARWNGSTWTVQSGPSIPNGTSPDPLAVSCFSATSCTAVGTFYNTSTSRGQVLAEHWNGSSWSLEPASTPGSATSSVFYGVSCKAATACTAVGDYVTTGDITTQMVQTWNGTAWSVHGLPALPPSTSFSELSAVSCSAATVCTAVGDRQTNNVDGNSLIQRSNGSTWTTQSFPVTGWYLSAVSCPASSACVTLGGGHVAGWNGTMWTPTTLAPAADGTPVYLDTVACTAATACTGAGYEERDVDMPMAERYS